MIAAVVIIKFNYNNYNSFSQFLPEEKDKERNQVNEQSSNSNNYITAHLCFWCALQKMEGELVKPRNEGNSTTSGK